MFYVFLLLIHLWQFNFQIQAETQRESRKIFSSPERYLCVCVCGSAGASGIVVPSVRWQERNNPWGTGSLVWQEEIYAERGGFPPTQFNLADTLKAAAQ